jgi:hypothetical protein
MNIYGTILILVGLMLLSGGVYLMAIPYGKGSYAEWYIRDRVENKGGTFKFEIVDVQDEFYVVNWSMSYPVKTSMEKDIWWLAKSYDNYPVYGLVFGGTYNSPYYPYFLIPYYQLDQYKDALVENAIGRPEISLYYENYVYENRKYTAMFFGETSVSDVQEYRVGLHFENRTGLLFEYYFYSKDKLRNVVTNDLLIKLVDTNILPIKEKPDVLPYIIGGFAFVGIGAFALTRKMGVEE